MRGEVAAARAARKEENRGGVSRAAPPGCTHVCSAGCPQVNTECAHAHVLRSLSPGVAPDDVVARAGPQEDRALDRLCIPLGPVPQRLEHLVKRRSSGGQAAVKRRSNDGQHGIKPLQTDLHRPRPRARQLQVGG